jgi:hypothetical protein
MDVRAKTTQRSTAAQDVAAPLTELMAALKACKQGTSTPLDTEVWHRQLTKFNLTHKYPTLANSIRYGFHIGIPNIQYRFSPPNWLESLEHQAAFQTVMEKELSTGRWLGPYSRTVIEAALGPFQTSPISMIPKSGKPGKFRLLENLSYPYRPVLIPSLCNPISSINLHIDSTLYPCLWGTFANTCRMIWTLPPGSQGAVRDISEAYRLIPLHPSQWAGVVIRVSDDLYCPDTRNMFGCTSAGGAFGQTADAGIDISRGSGLGPVTKWVDDHFWLRILKCHLEQYNSLRSQLRERVNAAGGIIHRRGRLLYQGHTLSSGEREEFDDDFTFPLQDLLSSSPQSAEDQLFTYAFGDIDKVTKPLGYTWAPDKDIHFCDSPTYFGFQWNISTKTVSVPSDKRLKYLNAISEWEQQHNHNSEHVAKLYGKLLHVSLVLTIGRAYLTELERFAADLSHEAPHVAHRAPCQWPADMAWWKTALSTPITCPIPGPADLIDTHAYSDASSSYGIGLYIHGYWRAYRLLPGWRGQGERDIGWAEAVGFYLLVLIIVREATSGHQYKIWGDNEGVVEGWWNGRTGRNWATNNIFRRLHEITGEHQFGVHTRYVASADNPADPFSRGKQGSTTFLLPRIPIPEELSRLIIDYDTPLTTAELYQPNSPRESTFKDKPTQRSHRKSFGQWQSEEEGKLLAAFRDNW